MIEKTSNNVEADIEGTKAPAKAAPLVVAHESHSPIAKTPSSSNHQHHHHPPEVSGLASQLSKEAHLLLNGVPSGSQAAIINDLFEDPQFLSLLHNKLVEVVYLWTTLCSRLLS